MDRAGPGGRLLLAGCLLCLLAISSLMCGSQPAATPSGAMVSRTGFVYDPLFLEHRTAPDHPERPERLRWIVRRLGETGLADGLVPLPAEPPDLKWVRTVHSRDHLERARSRCVEGAAYLDHRDTLVCPRSYEVALAAVGGVLGAVDAVAEGRVRNAFCAVRPPGHHATRERAGGFCIFNNVAVAARYAQRRHRLEKVLIVDWDVHHGNGTQEAFYDDPTVLYIGIHQRHAYPGTGSERERGSGSGEGLNANVPLPAGSGDREYVRAFKERLAPVAREFAPDLVLISAGFDAHADDPIGEMKVTAAGFAELTHIVMELADTCCGGRVVSVLEGGYGPEGLPDSVEAHLRALMAQ